jgi:hypothetical protein
VHLAVTLFKQFSVEHNTNILSVKVPLVDEGFGLFFLTVAVADTFTNARALTIVTTIYVKVLYKHLPVVLFAIL